jgi:hypothetical protein
VPPLNPDYARETIIAYVNGEPYYMWQLETAVRVAQALASFTGDPVPAVGTPEMRDFQVSMLRRELDGVLLRQALVRDGLTPPPGDATPVMEGFLGQYNVSEGDLASALAANGVTRADLERWFLNSRDTQYYIQTKLMEGQPPEQRDAIVKAWLDENFPNQVNVTDFYEPSPTLAAPSGSP